MAAACVILKQCIEEETDFCAFRKGETTYDLAAFVCLFARAFLFYFLSLFHFFFFCYLGKNNFSRAFEVSHHKFPDNSYVKITVARVNPLKAFLKAAASNALLTH